MDIGSNGLIQLNLIIPRGTSFDFDIELQDESDEYVSLEDATFKMTFKQDYQPFDMSKYVSAIDNTYTRYFATETELKPDTGNNSRFWLSTRQYKWIAIWI